VFAIKRCVCSISGPASERVNWTIWRERFDFNSSNRQCWNPLDKSSWRPVQIEYKIKKSSLVQPPPRIKKEGLEICAALIYFPPAFREFPFEREEKQFLLELERAGIVRYYSQSVTLSRLCADICIQRIALRRVEIIIFHNKGCASGAWGESFKN